MRVHDDLGPFVIVFVLGLAWSGFLVARLSRPRRPPSIRVESLWPVDEPRHSGVRPLAVIGRAHKDRITEIAAELAAGGRPLVPLPVDWFPRDRSLL